MGRLFTGILVAIVLLTAGAILLVSQLTEPPATTTARAAIEAAPSQAGADPGSPISVPAGPVVSGPVQNEPPPIQGPVPAGKPEDAAAYDEALANIRTQRRASQIELHNRRNPERPGGPQREAPAP